MENPLKLPQATNSKFRPPPPPPQWSDFLSVNTSHKWPPRLDILVGHLQEVQLYIYIDCVITMYAKLILFYTVDPQRSRPITTTDEFLNGMTCMPCNAMLV